MTVLTEQGAKVVWILQPSEVKRIACKHKLEGEGNELKLYGRLMELVLLNDLYELLKPYEDLVELKTVQGGKVRAIIEECFTNLGKVIDLQIPLLDEKIDAKAKQSDPEFYLPDISGKGELWHFSVANNKAEAMKQNGAPDILFACGWVSQTITSDSLATSITPNGVIGAKEVLVQIEQQEQKDYSWYKIKISKTWEEYKEELKRRLDIIKNL